jgi:hypothetical protein
MRRHAVKHRQRIRHGGFIPCQRRLQQQVLGRDRAQPLQWSAPNVTP